MHEGLIVTAALGFPAYVGPGGGISALGAVLAIVAAVLLAILGFVWYPVKRLLRMRRRSSEQSEDAGSS